MANTYQLISSVNLSSSASTITFSSIPNTYTDLLIKLSGRTDRVAVNCNCTIIFNGSSAANYSDKYLQGDGASATSGNDSASTTGYIGGLPGTSVTASTFGNLEIYIPNYNSSTAKSFSVDEVYENNATSAISILNAGLWSLTNAITSVTLGASGFNFVANTNAYLYGIKNS